MKPKNVEWKAADWNKLAEGGTVGRIFVNVVNNTFLICKNWQNILDYELC